MDPDLSLVIGIVLAVLTVPSVVSAYADGRPPRASILFVLMAGGLIVYALSAHPQGYALSDVPNAFFRVIGRYMN